MSKKYELTDETVIVDEHILHRIRAIRDIEYIYKGDLGGFIEAERNLSHEGNCWVYCNGKVYGDAHISGNVKIFHYVSVCGNTYILGDFKLYKRLKLYSGIWDLAVVKGDECYLISTTLQKLLLE